MYIEKKKNHKLIKTNIQVLHDFKPFIALITLSPNQQKFKTKIQGKSKSFMIQTTDIHMNTLVLREDLLRTKKMFSFSGKKIRFMQLKYYLHNVYL